MRGMEKALITGLICTALMLDGCTVARFDVPAGATTTATAALADSGLSARVDVRALGALSAAVTVHLTTRRPLAEVIVSVDRQGAALSVQPAECRFTPLLPPAVRHAAAPPYPLPAIPLCSLVLGARHGGRYPIAVRVTDRSGHNLVAPIHTTVVIQGESS